MNNLDINKVYNFCKLLNIECVKQEIEEKIKGYTLDKMELKNGEWTCSFHGKNREGIVLGISVRNIDLMKYNENFIEKMEINSNLVLTSKSIDRRENGILYSVLQKQFMPSIRFNNEIILADLVEKRYVFTKSNLKKLIDYCDFDNMKMSLFIFQMLKLERNGNLKKICDHYSEFLTRMNDHCSTERRPRDVKGNVIYPTRTYLNGNNISYLYDIEGPDKLYRIFDLYHGIINPRNEKDLDSINLGFIDSSAYDLITYESISGTENSLIGKPSKTIDKEYLNYLRKMFYNNFGYRDFIELNRDSILAAITCEITGYRTVKKMMERKLDTTNYDYEEHDVEEKEKTIEETKDDDTSNSKNAFSRLLRPFKKR